MGIIKSAFTVGVFTLFSRVIGFIRECMMVFCLGAGMHSDALLIALRISNTFRRIFAEGAFNASFLPRFSKILNKQGKNCAIVVLSDIFSVLLLILVPLSAVVIVFFPSFVKIFISGFDPLSEKFSLTISLGKICFPYLIFISIASLFCGVLNTLNKFALPSAVYSMLSIFTSIGLLSGYIFNLSSSETVYIVSFYVILSGIAQSYILFRSVQKHGFPITFRLRCWTDSVKDIMKNMIPGIIGAGVWQLNLLVDTAISSYFPTGTITCINLADRLNQFPLGTLGIALSTVLLPLLSRFISIKEYGSVSEELEKGLLFAFFLTFFATSVLTALDEQSVSVAFQNGMFEYEQVKITSNAVTGFAIGLPAYVLAKIFSTLYFAMGDTKSPVIFGILSVVLNVIFLFLLVPFFKYFGLSFCTSLSAISNASMLVYFIKRKIQINLSKTFWYKISSQMIAASITYFLLAKLAKLYWDPNSETKLIQMITYVWFLICASFVYFLTVVACLYATKQKKWKLWKREAW